MGYNEAYSIVIKNFMLILKPQWVIPVEPQLQILENHVVAIDEGVITDVFCLDDKPLPLHAEILELPGHALLPGFVNTHTHSPLALGRGLGNDLPLMTWLNEHIWPMEKIHMGNAFIHDGSLLAMAEMIKSGTTCFNEHYFLAYQSAKCAAQVGMRAQIGLWCGQMPTPDGNDVTEQLLTARENISKLQDFSPLISLSLAPHSPYLLDDNDMQAIKDFLQDHPLNVHMHVHEVAEEIDKSLQTYGKRPLKRMAELGLLSDRFLAVHFTQATDEDLAIIKDYNMSVVHAPHANMKLASGFCPVTKLSAQGSNVAIGTDSASGNNQLDMLSEMRTAALLGKVCSQEPTAVPAHEALTMATINGAKAMGLDDQIGSICAGKQADLIAINLHHINSMPVYDPISQIVYAASREQVQYVWVAGKCLLQQGKLTTIDETEVLSLASQWQHKIHSK